ncbi:unnamed protein product, partial [Phaeothamnion confervicola]
GGEITLRGVTLSGCKAELGGGIFLSSGCNLTAADTTFRRNYASKDGGAVYGDEETTMNFERCVFDANNASDSGGGIYQYAFNPGGVNLTASTFLSNFATGGLGGGIYARNVTVSGSNFTSNIAKEFGGALATFDDKGPVIDSSLFVKNKANVDGGAVRGPILDFQLAGGDQTTLLTRSVFTSNVAVRYGGGVYTSRLEVSDTVFTLNKSNRGGGIHSSRATVSDSRLLNNTAGQQGGGIFLGGLEVNLTISRVELINCTALIAGGGIFL